MDSLPNTGGEESKEPYSSTELPPHSVRLLKYLDGHNNATLGTIGKMKDFSAALDQLKLPFAIDVGKSGVDSPIDSSKGSAPAALRKLMDAMEPRLKTSVPSVKESLDAMNSSQIGCCTLAGVSGKDPEQLAICREGQWCQELVSDPLLKPELLGDSCIPWLVGFKAGTIAFGVSFVPVCGMPGFLLATDVPCNVILVHENLMDKTGDWSGTAHFVNSLDWRTLKDKIEAGVFYALKLMPFTGLWIPPRFSRVFAPDSQDAILIWQPWANRKLLQHIVETPADPDDHTAMEQIVQNAKRILESQRLARSVWPRALEFSKY